MKDRFLDWMDFEWIFVKFAESQSAISVTELNIPSCPTVNIKILALFPLIVIRFKSRLMFFSLTSSCPMNRYINDFFYGNILNKK